MRKYCVCRLTCTSISLFHASRNSKLPTTCRGTRWLVVGVAGSCFGYEGIREREKEGNKRKGKRLNAELNERCFGGFLDDNFFDNECAQSLSLQDRELLEFQIKSLENGKLAKIIQYIYISPDYRNEIPRSKVLKAYNDEKLIVTVQLARQTVQLITQTK